MTEMDPEEDWHSGRMGGEVARETTGGQVTLCGGFTSGHRVFV